MPSLPVLFTTTALPVTAAPLMPAMKVAVCVPWVPMRMVLDSAAAPALPISMLLLPVVRLNPALRPSPMLLLPVVLKASALSPAAVLKLPVVLCSSACSPSAVL